MESFSLARREMLKFGGIGLATSIATLSAFAAEKRSSEISSTPHLFDIRTYGAVGDGKTVDSPAINKAIEAAAAAGGGTVLFPAGTWLCFSIHLKSHVALYLGQGSTILAADSPLPGATTGYNGGTYDAAEPNTAWDAYQDYGHNHWHNSLLWGEDIHDISITGPGLIYGKGLSFGATRAARGNYPLYKAEQAGVGNKAIALKNCRNVIFRDFSILKGGHFGLLLTGVDNLTIDNLTIDTDRDGMDIDCCKNVRVSNCFVNSPWDDAICPKSSYALGYSRATENVTITNCYVSGYYELGTLLDGTFKKFAPDFKARATAASSAVRNPTADSRTSPSPTACSKDVWGLRSRAKTAPSVKISRSPTSPCATSSTRRSSSVSALACAGPRRAPRSERSAASSSTTSSATTPAPTSVPSLAAFPITRFSTSSSPTSTSSIREAPRPTPPRSSCQKMLRSILTHICSAPIPRHRASTFATLTTSR